MISTNCIPLNLIPLVENRQEVTNPHRATEDVTIRGILIPKDTIVISDIYGANRDSLVLENDVEEFSPDRFFFRQDPDGQQ
jgi:hypothetical protein